MTRHADKPGRQDYEVIATTSVLGHKPGEKFTRKLTGAHLLLVGSHLKPVQHKSDSASREEEE